MRFIQPTIENLECFKCARMIFHCANGLVLVLRTLEGTLLAQKVGAKSKNGYDENVFEMFLWFVIQHYLKIGSNFVYAN